MMAGQVQPAEQELQVLREIVVMMAAMVTMAQMGALVPLAKQEQRGHRVKGDLLALKVHQGMVELVLLVSQEPQEEPAKQEPPEPVGSLAILVLKEMMATMG